MSSEDFEPLKLLRRAKRELKHRYGVRCEMCVALLPRANPSLLLPGQRCRIHGWRNDAPRIDPDVVDGVFREFGLEKMRGHDPNR